MFDLRGLAALAFIGLVAIALVVFAGVPAIIYWVSNHVQVIFK